MDGTTSCCSSFGSSISSCFAGIGSGIESASTCISKSCSTLGSSIGSGCSAMGKGLSRCCGSFTTCISGFFSSTLWPCIQRITSATGGFFSSAWAYIKSDPTKLKHVSIGCLVGTVSTVIAFFCCKRFFCITNKSDDAPEAQQ